MFQELQLLRELPPEKLPKESEWQSRDGKNEREKGKEKLSSSTIQAWEESLDRRERSYAAPVSVEVLFSNWQQHRGREGQSATPRFVVLGPPGSGKSTFIQILARRTATGKLRLNSGLLTPVRVRLLEWQKAGGQRLACYLAMRAIEQLGSATLLKK